jgi:hypothetical protein
MTTSFYGLSFLIRRFKEDNGNDRFEVEIHCVGENSKRIESLDPLFVSGKHDYVKKQLDMIIGCFKSQGLLANDVQAPLLYSA